MHLSNAFRRFRRAAMEGVNWPRLLGFIVRGQGNTHQRSTNELLTLLRSSP